MFLQTERERFCELACKMMLDVDFCHGRLCKERGGWDHVQQAVALKRLQVSERLRIRVQDGVHSDNGLAL